MDSSTETADKLEIQLGPSGTVLTLDSFGALIFWVEEEASYWAEFRELFVNARKLSASFLHRLVPDHANRWGTQERAFKAAETPVAKAAALSSLQTQLASTSIVSRASSVGARIAELAPRDPDLAGFYLAAYLRGVPANFRNMHDGGDTLFRELVRLIAEVPSADRAADPSHLQQQLGEAAAAVANSRQALLDLKRDAAAALTSLRQEIRDENEAAKEQATAIDGAAGEQREEIEGQWQALKRRYDEGFKTAAPRAYWKQKATSHRYLAIGWLLLFCLLVGGATSYLLSSYERQIIWIAAQTQLAPELVWVTVALRFGVPAFLLLWVLRIAARHSSDHFLRSEDAGERVVMVETFLALIQDDDSARFVQNEQLGVVLNALYRPGPGLSADDAPPSSLIEALARMATEGKKP